MSYVRGDGGLAQARRRRHRRSMIVIAVAAAMVLGAFLYAVTYMNNHGQAAPTAPSSCDATQTPPPQSVFVLNIYNASPDSGQAKATGIAMTSHGFRVGTVSNDPYKEHLSDAGQIRFGPKGKKNAIDYVKKYAPDATLKEDGRTDDSVDLVLGDNSATVKSAPPTTTTPPPGCPA